MIGIIQRSGYEEGALYRFTSNQLYSCGFAGVALGIARAVIDAFVDLRGEQVVARRGQADPGEQRGAVAVGAVGGAMALGARVPARCVA